MKLTLTYSDGAQETWVPKPAPPEPDEPDPIEVLIADLVGVE